MKVYITYEESGFNDPVVSKVFADKELAIDHCVKKLDYLKGNPVWTDKRIRQHAEEIGVEEFEVQE